MREVTRIRSSVSAGGREARQAKSKKASKQTKATTAEVDQPLCVMRNA